MIKLTDYFNDSDKVVSVKDIVTIDDKDDYEVVQLAASKAFTLMKCDTHEVYEHLGIKKRSCTMLDIQQMFGKNVKLKNASICKKLMSGTLFKNITTKQIYILTYDTVHHRYIVVNLYNGVSMYCIDCDPTSCININNYKELFGYATNDIYIMNNEELVKFLDNWR